MNRAMYTAASGMAAQEQELDTIADNLANSEVAGFKQTMLKFSAMTDGRQGYGTQVDGKQLVFKQGKLVRTGGPFDLALNGPGFFVLHNLDGSKSYTRDGQFARNPDGSVRSSTGAVLEGVRIPSDALAVRVAVDGHVFIDTPHAANVAAGQIKIAMFPSPERLQPTSDHSYLETAESGKPLIVQPGKGFATRVMFGQLEQSNVSVMEAMMEILAAQRAFEANSKGVQAANEMLQTTNNIQRN